jgi:hypothetical protein
MAQPELELSLREDWFETLNDKINEVIEDFKDLCRRYISGYEDVTRPNTNHHLLSSLNTIILQITNKVRTVTVTFAEELRTIERGNEDDEDKFVASPLASLSPHEQVSFVFKSQLLQQCLTFAKNIIIISVLLSSPTGQHLRLYL